jgi:hypothetical protein
MTAELFSHHSTYEYFAPFDRVKIFGSLVPEYAILTMLPPSGICCGPMIVPDLNGKRDPAKRQVTTSTL